MSVSKMLCLTWLKSHVPALCHFAVWLRNVEEKRKFVNKLDVIVFSSSLTILELQLFYVMKAAVNSIIAKCVNKRSVGP